MIISGLRFIERNIPAPKYGEDIYRTVKILQFMHPSGEWEDVPLFKTFNSNNVEDFVYIDEGGLR